MTLADRTLSGLPQRELDGDPPVARGGGARRRAEALTGYGFLAPALLLLGLFLFVPLGWAFACSGADATQDGATAPHGVVSPVMKVALMVT